MIENLQEATQRMLLENDNKSAEEVADELWRFDNGEWFIEYCDFNVGMNRNRFIKDMVEDEEDVEFMSKVYGLIYDKIEAYNSNVKNYLNNLNESDNSENTYFGHTIEDDIEDYDGPVGYDRFLQRAIDYGVEDEAFETYGNRSQSSIDKVVRKYYKDYKQKFKEIKTSHMNFTESYEDEENKAIEIANKRLKEVKSSQELCDLVDKYFQDKMGLGFPLYLISNHKWCLYDGTVIDDMKAEFLLTDGVSHRIVDYRTAYKYYRFSNICR